MNEMSFLERAKKYSEEELKEFRKIDSEYNTLQSEGIFLQLEDNSLVLYRLDIPFLQENFTSTFDSNHYYAY
jgi:hypothetical protein